MFGLALRTQALVVLRQLAADDVTVAVGVDVGELPADPRQRGGLGLADAAVAVGVGLHDALGAAMAAVTAIAMTALAVRAFGRVDLAVAVLVELVEFLGQ